MADRSLRGIRLGAQSLQSEEGVVFMERRATNYKCAACGHETTLMFAADADAPQTWECRACGAEAVLQVDGASVAVDDGDEKAAVREDELRIAAPHRELLDQVLDKWSLSVLNELCERPSRFNALRRAIPGVTQKSLTATLRRLERNGVVQRRVISTRPVSVEYRITTLGKTLRVPVDALIAWADEQLPAIERARIAFDEDEQ